MHEDITARIRRCLKCQLQKFRRESAKHPMIICDQPKESFQKCALDICGPFSETKEGNTCILTMQCLFSRFVIMVPIPDQTAEIVTDAFIKRLICTFGCPQKILTDQGKNFMSIVFKGIAKKFKIEKCSTTAYRPSSNGVKERSHGPLNEFSRLYTDKDTERDILIEYASFCYNTSKNFATGFTTYEIVFGKEARLPNVAFSETERTYCDYITDLIKHLDRIKK